MDAASCRGICTGRVFHPAEGPVERAPAKFLLEMQNLPAAAKSDSMSGAHVCRHCDGCESVSADQFYIRQGKGAGGLKDDMTALMQHNSY